MTLTHAQLLDAVRAAGRDRKSFTCADVRQQLGLSTADRKQMSRFYSRFRALQQGDASELEKLGNNCYRLRAPADEPAVAASNVTAEPAPHDEVLALAEPAPHEEALAEPAPHEDVMALAEPAPYEDVMALAELAPHDEVLALAESLPSVGEVVALAEPLPSAREARARTLEAAEVPLAETMSPNLAPARPAPAKRRAPWLSRMASFFSRRGGKNDVAPGVAIGA